MDRIWSLIGCWSQKFRRREAYRALFARAFLDRARTDGIVVWRLAGLPGVERESRRLAELERARRSDVRFDVRVDDGDVIWRIIGPADRVLDHLYELPVELPGWCGSPFP